MSFAVLFAPAHASQHHITAILVVQIDTGFHASKGLRHFVDHAVNQLIEIENRRDSLRGFLHTLQVVDKIGGQSTDVDNLVAGGTRKRCHRNQSFLRKVAEPRPC